jgi:hypothetical protein
MQTLNVGAGLSNDEYKAAEEQRRADLKSDARTYALYFFVAAGLAGVGTGLSPVVHINILFGIGAIELLGLYGGTLLRVPLLLQAAAAAWVILLVALGFAALKGHRWAFWAGVILYGADMIALTVTFSIFAVGVHGFFVFAWFKGQKTLADLKEPRVAAAAASN